MRIRVFALALSVLAATPRAEAAADLSIDLGAGVRVDLVRVKAGKFLQGSPPGEAGRGDDESQREVTISRDFYIGAHEVTRGQFARFVAETGYRTEAEKGSSGGFGWDGQALVQRKEFTWRNPGFPQTDDHPVVIVTYDDALAFTAWLSAKARRAVTLPTEAQWEYAARAGSRSRFYTGDAEDAMRTAAWYKSNDGSGTQPVGQKKPNAWGLYDVSGNAYEWCRDWYAPYAPGPVADPEEMRSTFSDKPRRVLRGGSWRTDAKAGRSAARYRNTPGSRNADNGFRVVASVEQAAASAPVAAAGAAGARATAPAPSRLAPGEPPAAFPFFGALLLVLGMTLVVFFHLLFRRSRGSSTGYPGITTRMGPDGFWLDAPTGARGATVRYRVFVEGAPQTGELVLERDRGQFVYTGGKPSSVEVLGVAAAAGLMGAGLLSPPRTPTRTPTTRRVDDDVPPFRGYPSAY